jgi:hypothetical protein
LVPRARPAFPLASAVLLAASFAAGAPAAAQAPAPVRGHPTVGLRVSWLHAVQVSGGIDTTRAGPQSLSLALQLYGEWQLSDLVAVGLGVPATLNAPGPSSSAYDVGVAPRIRLGRVVSDGIYPYVVAAPGPAWSRVPQGVWLPGFTFTAGAGASLDIGGPFSFIVELGYQYTSFSGNAPLYSDGSGTAPLVHAAARVSALALGGGFELRL